MSKLKKIFLTIVSTLVIVCVISLELTIDNTPIYDDFEIDFKDDFTVDTNLYLGFSKVSIIPQKPVSLVGYGLRDQFIGVNDSVFVRTLVFNNNNRTIAFVSYDLMIVTPQIVKQVKDELESLNIDDIYFTATHTHSSIGGYGEGFLGRLILGGKEEEVISLLKNSTIKCLQKAQSNKSKVSTLNYNEQSYNKVKNRLTQERNVNQKLRNVLFRLENGKDVRLISSNSHPTIISHESKKISGDYPGIMCKSDTSDFTLFCAGAMGSLTPIIHVGNNSFERAKKYSELLLKSPITRKISLNNFDVSFNTYKVENLKYGIQLSQFFKVREWLFKLLMYNPKPKIDVFRIGNLLFVSLPVELSAEYYNDLQKLANSKGLILMITSFNGSYLGYATPSEHFNTSHMETREMNWLGKYGGDYFFDLIIKIIEKQ